MRTISMRTPTAMRSRLTPRECELSACRKGRIAGKRQLKVMCESVQMAGDLVRMNGRLVSGDRPYMERTMLALITIHGANEAYIEDVTMSGNLTNCRPIRCNGTVSRRDMRAALDISDGDERIYAVRLR